MSPFDTTNRAALEDAHCWFATDGVSRQPAVTTFKRRARLHQANWREQRGLPIGSHWSGRPRVQRPNGSRIELGHAQATYSNFLSERIRDAVRHRLKAPEPHQMIDEDRLWSDLLSSMPMCFNLFGELHDDPQRLASAVTTLWPDFRGRPDRIRFEWSPAGRSPKFLGDRTAFDAAITLTESDGSRGVIGIETKYHEHITPGRAPDPKTHLPRYRQVANASGAFKPGWEDAIIGRDLQQIWRDHLLVLSMLQQQDERWTEGKYVLVHPAGNPSFADAGQRYRALLEDDSTFEVRTIEELLDARLLHPPTVEQKFRERYLWT